MTMEDAVKHLENMKWLLGVNNTTVDDIPLTKVIDDIAALLKAQEPRVMTPDEVKNAPKKSVVWLELKPDEIFKNEIYPFVGSGTGWYSCYCSANTTPMFTDDDVEKYGVEFRCWTSRPTDAQREAIPWQG